MKEITELKKILFQIPDITYHYTSLDSALNIISSEEIWLTKFDFLNDPSEIKYTENLMTEVFNENKHFRENLSLEGLVEKILKGLEYSFIFSLSHNYDALGLWTYYSNMKGINIHISKDLIQDPYLFDEEENFFTINKGKVIYDQVIQKSIIKEILQNLIKEDLEKDAKESLEYLMVNCFLLFKQNSLNSEEEYRYVYTGHGNKILSRIKFRMSNDKITPYLNFPIDISSIKGFTLSPTMKSDDFAYGLELLCKQKGIKFKTNNSSIILR